MLVGVARLILCADESLGALHTVRGLRRAGHEPWLAVTQRSTYAARSRDAAGILRLAEARRDPRGFAEELADHARRLEVDAVLPASETTLSALTGNEELFGKAVVGTSPRATLERATDKGLLGELAERAGLRAPRTWPADGLPSPAPFPVLVKPRRSTSPGADGRLTNVEVVAASDEATLAAAIAAAGDGALVQEVVAGPLSAVSGVAWKGNSVCTVHQVSLRIWPPARGITAYGQVVEPDPERDAAVRRFVSEIGWSGIFQAQFVGPPENARLIDFNPRIYGSIGLAIGAGANLPAIWVDLLLGREPTVGVARPGVRYRIFEDDLRALLAARSPSATLRALPPRRRTVGGIFSLRDPAPVLVSAAKVLRVLGRRTRRS